MNQQGSKKQREKIVQLFCLGIFDTWMWETGTMDQRILLQFIDPDRSILCKLLVQTTILFARLCKTFDKIRVCALVPLCKLTFPDAICHLCTKPIHYLGNVYASALFKKRQNQFGQCPKWWRKSVFFFRDVFPFVKKKCPTWPPSLPDNARSLWPTWLFWPPWQSWPSWQSWMIKRISRR